MRKRIGIPAFKTGENFGVGLNHLEFVNNFGDPVLIMPHEEKVKVDLLYLTGGLDLNPSSYGEIPGFKTSNTDVYKQFFFDKRLKNYVSDTPIFGVCLGFQMLNVFFGGKLTQHAINHPQSSDRFRKGHEVSYITSEGIKEKFEVNSHHHQLVRLDQLGNKLTPVAIYEDSSKNPVVEAFAHQELPIVAVQWHPEEWYDNFSKSYINSLLKI